MELAELKLKFSSGGAAGVQGDLRAVDAGINKIEHDSHSAGGAMKSMFATAGGFVLGQGMIGLGREVLNLGKGFVMTNAQMEQAHLSLETVTGSATKADTIFKSVQDFAAKTPFSFPELEQSTINLEAFGLKSQQWLPVIGDTASAMGKSVDQVTQAVLDAATGQYERLKELGISTSIEGDKLSFMYMKNGKQIVETVDKNNKDVVTSTLMAIWNSKYQGAMEKQSKSFSGLASTVKDDVNIKMAQMTEGIFTSLKGVLSFTADVFGVGWTQALTNAFGDSPFGGFLSDLGTFVGDIVDAFGEHGKVSDIVKDLPTSWQPAADAILKVADAIGDLWHAFAPGGEKEGLGGLFSQLDDEIKQVGKAGLDLGVIAIKGSFHLATNITTNIYDWVRNELFGSYQIGDATGGPMDAGAGLQDIGIGDVGIAIGKLFVSTIAGWADDATTNIQTWLDTNQLSGFTQAIRVDALSPTFGDLAIADYGQAIKDALNADPIVVTPEMDIQIQLGVEQWLRDHQDISIDFSTIKDLMIGGFIASDPIGAFNLWLGTKALPDALKVTRDILFGGFNFLFTAPDTSVPSPSGPPTSIAGVNFIQGWSDGLAGWLNDQGDALIQPIVDFFTNIPSAVGDKIGKLDFSGMWTDLASAFENGISDATFSPVGSAIANGIWNAIKSIVSGWSLSDFLPSWAGGGSDDSSRNKHDPATPNPAGGGAINQLSAGGFASDIPAIVFKKPDDHNVTDGLRDLGAKVNAFVKADYTAVISANVGPANLAFIGAEAMGANWNASVFSATITADFSQAMNAAATAAQFIKDHLPSSPAKRGPLSKLPRWDALFEGIGPAGDHAANLVADHAAMIAGAFGGRMSRYGGTWEQATGGVHYHEHVYQLDGAVLGAGAHKEIQRMAADGTIKIVRGNQRSGRYAGAKLP